MASGVEVRWGWTAVTTAAELFDIPMPPVQLRPEPKRDRWGRYLLAHPASGNEATFTRVSTLKEQTADQYGLTKWKMSTVAQGLAYEAPTTEEQRGGKAKVLDRLVRLIEEEADYTESLFKKRVAELAEEAFVLGGGTYAADMGTAFHAWAEWADLGLGTADDMPDMFAPSYRAYRRQLDSYGIIVETDFIERICVNLAFEVAGTLDRVFRLADGTLCIGDVKSGKDIRLGWREHAAQLAAYQTAEFVLNDADEWEPSPEYRVDFGIIAHVPVLAPEASCELLPIDLAAGRSALNLCRDVKQWRARRDPPHHVIPTAGSKLAALVNAANSEQEMAELYSAYEAEWTPQLTMLGQRRLAALSK